MLFAKSRRKLPAASAVHASISALLLRADPVGNPSGTTKNLDVRSSFFTGLTVDDAIPEVLVSKGDSHCK